jgi:mono/diheme cytochrome c family protein
MMGIRRAAAIGSLLGIASVVGCAPSVAEPGAAPVVAAVTVTPEMVAQGRTLFTGQGRCAVCHGQNARGGQLGPNLTDGEWIWIDTGQNVHSQLFAIIRDGIEEPRRFPAPMPAMGGGTLSDEQIHALAAFVNSLNPGS